MRFDEIYYDILKSTFFQMLSLLSPKEEPAFLSFLVLVGAYSWSQTAGGQEGRGGYNMV